MSKPTPLDPCAARRTGAALGCARCVVALAFAGGLALAGQARVAAQAADTAPPQTASAPPADTPASETPRSSEQAGASVEAQIAELTARIAAQEREITRQKEALRAYEKRLDRGQSAIAKDEAAQIASSEVTSAEVRDATQSFVPGLRLYGFADAGIQRTWGGIFDSGLGLSDAANFVLGNVDIYFDATPVEHWRFLTEVRFTTLPDGSESFDMQSGAMQRQTTGVQDQSSTAGGFLTIHWGGIVLERAQIEWTPMDALNLRVGYFLTPYGIWNVDHGSPTRIMLRPPLFVSLALMPERQTGIDLFGVFHVLPWDLGYDLYVSNGRTIASVDFSDDKAFGGRVYVKTRRPFPMQLGASFFRGATLNFSKSPGVNAMGQAILKRTEIEDYDERDYGLDLSIDAGALRIRAELVTKTVVYEPGKHTTALGMLNANVTDSGGYLMFAYRLPWLGLEPIVVGEYLRYPNPAYGEMFLVPGGGLNVYINSAVTLRTQYSYAQAVSFRQHSRDYSHNNLHVLAARLIIAF
jgi:uncharacterized coiled-coil protein SlyX